MVELLPVDGSAPLVVFEGQDTTTESPGILSIPVEQAAGDYFLRISYVSECEATVLAVNAPDGSWLCSDAAEETLDGMVEFNPPQSGQYDTWVGTYSQGSTLPGTLYFTEQAIDPGTLPTSK
ncbi:hypothetical protein ACFLYO_00375 [Chloroflexota bacterium]